MAITENEEFISLTPEERRDGIDEMIETRKRLLDLQLQTIVRYNDLIQTNSERGFNLIISLISISTAFIALVTPLVVSLHTTKLIAVVFLFLSFAFFLFCALDGITYLLWLVFFDKKELQDKNDFETKRLNEIQDKIGSIYGKLKDNEGITLGEINDAFSQGAQFKKASNERRNEIDKKRSTRALNLLHKLFFGFFFAGLTFLVVFLIQNF